MSVQSGMSGSRKSRLAVFAGLFIAILLGAFLRTIWGDDIEYKDDERFTFEHSQAIGASDPWPWTGMPMSLGPPNPGLSVWVFSGLARISGAGDPPALARAVQLTNIAALLLLLVFVCRVVPPAEREAWFWAIALVSVSAMPVILQRKIWPPSILPLFTLAMVFGWWYRARPWGALLWGVAGALIAQIHVPSGLFSVSFAVWTALFQRRSAAWRFWFLGSLLAALPALPWAWKLLTWHGPFSPSGAVNLIIPRFWGIWMEQSAGLGLENSLSSEFWQFLSWPSLGGHPLYGMLVLNLALAGTALAAGWPELRWALTAGRGLGHRLIGRGSATDFAVAAALWGFGILLTLLTMRPFHHNYLIVLFFFPWLWLSVVILRGHGENRARARMFLLILCIGQALNTASFLVYVHQKQVIDGEYGATWRSQQTAPAP
jgi:hypothetical protein